MNGEELFAENSTLWAEVILPLATPNTYTYAVPEQFQNQLQPGMRAEVVFGKNKKYAGIVKSIVKKKPDFPAKSILNILDQEPLLFDAQLKLWNWIASYYMCTEGEVMAAALPTNFKLSSESIIVFQEEYGEDFSNLDDEEFLVAEALLIRKQLNLTEIQRILNATHVYPVIKRLIDENLCFVYEELAERYKTKKENFVTLHPAYNTDEALEKMLNNWKGAPKQNELLLAFLHLQKTEGEVLQSELLKKSGATSAQLNGLAEKNILIVEKRSVDRLKSLPKKVETKFELTDLQQQSLTGIQKGFSLDKTVLLHGVTGSGKTLLYIKLIEQFFNTGKQALYLLPEIALTSQIIRRLQVHFGGNIAIYHSKFSAHERVELWNKVRSSEVKIILGARSALFLPFKELGLIIVDEEHEASYKQQDPAPRYHARDAAIYLASLTGAHVLLGSASPTLESYHNALAGKYHLVELTERFGGLQLPATEIINLAQVAQKGKVMMSPQLKAALEKELERNKQVILFQNRRGYNPYIICSTCGNIPQCVHCDVSLTLHKYSNKMHCHYCGSTYPKMVECNRCGTVAWMEKNFGTEKIEELLEEQFPKARIARMDVDSVRGKHAHDSLVQMFEKQRIDILVGTQMVVKGLDFENVSLVGILDADGLLSFADFRVHERAFQLMEQVSGRAGRKGEQGKVMIQALDVKNPVLKLVAEHNYKAFYEMEIQKRKEFLYPPFSRLLVLTLKHKLEEKVQEAAELLTKYIASDFQQYVTGPSAPVISRVRNQYLREIMIKLPKEADKPATYKKVIRHHINLLLSEQRFRSVQVVADVDPV